MLFQHSLERLTRKSDKPTFNMVYYIRFLNGPVSKDSFVSGTITISTDLRERLLCWDIPLNISIFSNSEIAKQTIEWKNGMYGLKFKVQLPQNFKGSVKVYVSPQSSQSRCWNCPSINDKFPLSVIPVCCFIDSQNNDSFERLLSFPKQKKVLTVIEKRKESIEGHIWDAGFILVNIFSSILYGDNPSLKILELGCGTGLIGLSMAILLENCHVTLTDLEEASELVHRNVSLNEKQFAHQSSAQFKVLKWANHPKWLSTSTWDIVIIGDCTYNPDYSKDLLTTLKFVLQKDIIIILASKLRHQSENKFDDMLIDQGIVEINRLTINLENEPHCPKEMVYIKTLVKRQSSGQSKPPEWILHHGLLKLLKVNN